MTHCLECVPCEADGCDRDAYCLAQPGTRPCAHDRQLGECHRLEECQDCRLEAEIDMYTTGAYSDDADPFFNPTAKALDADYWARAPHESDAAAWRWTDDGGAA